MSWKGVKVNSNPSSLFILQTRLWVMYGKCDTCPFQLFTLSVWYPGHEGITLSLSLSLSLLSLIILISYNQYRRTKASRILVRCSEIRWELFLQHILIGILTQTFGSLKRISWNITSTLWRFCRKFFQDDWIWINMLFAFAYQIVFQYIFYNSEPSH